jgi:hypothetical protein
MLDLSRLAHEQHPDAEVENLGELVDLGNNAVRDEGDRETSNDDEERE